MLTARSDALSRKIPAELRQAFQQDARKVGEGMVLHEARSRKVAEYRQAAPRVNPTAQAKRPTWAEDAGRPAFNADTNKNGLATAAAYADMQPNEYTAAIKALQQSAQRPDIQFYGDELVKNGTLPKRDFFKFQNEMHKHLIATGQRSEKQLKAARKAAQKGGMKEKAVRRVIAEQARIEASIDQGLPLKGEDARKAVVIKAGRAKEKAKDAIAESPTIPPNLKGRLRGIIEDVANTKDRDAKANRVIAEAARLEQMGMPDVAEEFLAIATPVTEYGKLKR
jgi:hypothetical protein